MWRHADLIRTDVSEERDAPIIRVKRISKLGTTLTVTSIWNTPPQYSPDLASNDLFLFPSLKIAVKGKIFEAA
jgi:hypothetical protein